MRKIAVLLVLLFIASCAEVTKETSGPFQVPAPSEHVLTGGLVKTGYTIADTLVSQAKVAIGPNDAILVASFVNINNLQESSTLGRMLAEHVASRLSQRGYKVIDMRLSVAPIFTEEAKGAFVLSRNLREVCENHNAIAVVIGTYGEALYGTYVSVRMVSPGDNAIMSSADYGMVLGRDAPEYLKRNK